MKAHEMFYMDCHLAGRKYYDADLVWDRLQTGMTVRLELEPDNRFDPNAVQVIFNNDGEDYLLGYIPRSDNQKIAGFLEMGWGDIFECRISKLNPEAYAEQQVHLTIKIKRKETTTKKQQNR